MGNNVSASDLNKGRDIKRSHFQAALNQAQIDVEIQKQAMSIFNTYAKKTAGGADDVLDVNEQRQAQAAFEALDMDDLKGVEEHEFESKKKDDADLKDTSYQVYSAFTQALGSIKPKPKSSVEVAKEKYKDEESVKKAVVAYLLGIEDTSSLDDEVTDFMVIHSDIEITMPDKGSTDPIKVTYNGKEYTVHYMEKFDGIPDGLSISSQDETLQEAILNNDNDRDVRHNYLNRHGADGNSQSTYDADTGVITNTSGRRQHVNPAQTFASMIVNDNTDSTLTFTQGLDAQDVIGVITGDEDADGITLPQLMKYLRAVWNETADTVNAGVHNGSRTAARDLDIDDSDMANIGLVFRDYAGSDGKLDKDELQKLIDDLTTKGNTMTKLARESKNKYNNYQPSTPVDNLPEATPVNPAEPKPQPKTEPKPGEKGGPKLLERNVAGSDKKQKVHYQYDKKTGMRTAYENGQPATNYNIAEYEDHGPFGIGQKDFVKIQGLPPAVRAEVFTGELKQDMVIKVKDSRGNEKYYKVTYSATDGSYKLGDQITEKTAKRIKNPPKAEKPKAEKSKKQDQTPQFIPEGSSTVNFNRAWSTIQSTVIKGDHNEPVAHVTKIADLMAANPAYIGTLHLRRDLTAAKTFAGNLDVSSTEIKNKNGKVIIKYDAENKKYYDGKGKELTNDEVYTLLADIYVKHDGKYKDVYLVQNIKQPTQAKGTPPATNGADFSQVTLAQWATRAEGIDPDDTTAVDQFVTDFISCHKGKSPEEVKYAYGLTNDPIRRGTVNDYQFKLEEYFDNKVEIHCKRGDYEAKIADGIVDNFTLSDEDDFESAKIHIQALLDAVEDKPSFETSFNDKKISFDDFYYINGVTSVVKGNDDKYTITVDGGETAVVDNNAEGFKRALKFVQSSNTSAS